MSRIGNQPIQIPSGVKVSLDKNIVKVEGSKATLTQKLPPLVKVVIENDVITVARDNDTKEARSMHGLTRSLINSMVIGVTTGCKKQLEIRGVGYRAQVQGQKLNLSLGYSHPVIFDIPQGITITVENNTLLTIEGADKQMVGEVAATVRRYRKPEPYKGKGIRYVGEHVVMKEGKTVG